MNKPPHIHHELRKDGTTWRITTLNGKVIKKEDITEEQRKAFWEGLGEILDLNRR